MIKEIVKIIIDNIIYTESFFITVKKHGIKPRLLILRKDMLGDMILFYPTLKSYRKKCANHDITLVMSSQFKSFASLLTNFDRILWFDHVKYRRNFFYRRSFLLNLKRDGYSCAIYPTSSREPTGDFMMKISNAEEIIGVNGNNILMSKKIKNKNNKMYSRLIELPHLLKHQLQINSYISEQITEIPCNITFPTIALDELPKNDFISLQNKYNLFSPYAIICPGASASYKMWPENKFIETIDYINEKGWKTVICGVLKETMIAQNILSKLKFPEKNINLCGMTDLPTLAHLIAKSVFFLGNDTGTSHLAVAVNAETVIILGGGHFGMFFPYPENNKCHVVYDKKMKCMNDNWHCVKSFTQKEPAPCVRDVSVKSVLEEIEKLGL